MIDSAALANIALKSATSNAKSHKPLTRRQIFNTFKTLSSDAPEAVAFANMFYTNCTINEHAVP